MSTTISIINVKDYKSIPDAVVAAIKAIEKDLPFKIASCKQILLKPNLLGPNKNACTQPSFVEGVLKYLKGINVPFNNVRIGDSPGLYRTTASDVAKFVGMYELCEQEGVKFINFEGEPPVAEILPDALRMKDIHIAKAVKECDLIVNLPRLKTHAEATITGAIKNYWGIVPGGIKAKCHLLGKNAEGFGQVLADNFSWVVKNIKNRLTVFDLQSVMEGRLGPVTGPMAKWDIILAGTDELALDLIALEIGKVKDIKKIPHLKSAIERKLGLSNLSDIKILGMSLDDAKSKTPKFNVPGGALTGLVSYMSGHVAYKIMKKIPDLKIKKCKKCGQCSKICPANAIEFKDGDFPKYVRKKCISCLCCMELCPHHAIDIKKRGLVGIFD